jgi:hypothetical protein
VVNHRYGGNASVTGEDVFFLSTSKLTTQDLDNSLSTAKQRYGPLKKSKKKK